MSKISRILVVSDTHVPDRADEIPKAIEDHFRGNSYDVIVHAGDLIDYSVVDFMKNLGRELYVVRGNMDYIDLPEKAVFNVYGVPVGVVHGDQVYPRGDVRKLSVIAKKMGVYILISGHTHKPFIVFEQGVLHVNPGSLTGVWGGGGGGLTPSFVELVIDDVGNVDLYLYVLKDGSLLLSRRERFSFST